MQEKSYNAYQLAELLRATPGTVTQWMRSGELPFVGADGGSMQVSEKHLRDFLRHRGMDVRGLLDGGNGDRRHKEPPARKPAAHGDPAAQLAAAIFKDAVARRASAIHLCQEDDGLSLRLRIDGVLHDRPSFKSLLPHGLGPKLIGRLRQLACLPEKPHRKAERGVFTQTVDGRATEAMLSSVPTSRGLRLVLRLRDPAAAPADFDALGLSQDQQETLLRLLGAPAGLIILAGDARTRNGALLAAMAVETDRKGRDAFCVGRGEARGDALTHIHPSADGMSYAEAVRAACLADADAIFLDDLSEPDAAVAAVDAAREGRLVVAAAIASSAPAAAVELCELLAVPQQACSVLKSVIAHRAVRLLCRECRLPQEQPAGVPRHAAAFPGDERPLFAPRGCPRCGRTGYAGQGTVLSIMNVGPLAAGALRRGEGLAVVEKCAAAEGLRTLEHAALELARDGSTSLAELARAGLVR